MYTLQFHSEEAVRAQCDPAAVTKQLSTPRTASAGQTFSLHAVRWAPMHANVQYRLLSSVNKGC